MLEHKTAVKVKRREGLPVVSFVSLLGDKPWAPAWLALRRDFELDAAINQTLMPAPGLDGSWSAYPIKTCDAAEWLTQLLVKYGSRSPDSLANTGSHALKATLLSWLAKAGVPKQHRRLLGGHSKPGDKSLIEYSRDELAEPLRLAGEVLAKIKAGIFSPDATRSGRWLTLQAPSTPVAGKIVEWSAQQGVLRSEAAMGWQYSGQLQQGSQGVYEEVEFAMIEMSRLEDPVTCEGSLKVGSLVEEFEGALVGNQVTFESQTWSFQGKLIDN